MNRKIRVIRDIAHVAYSKYGGDYFIPCGSPSVTSFVVQEGVDKGEEGHVVTFWSKEVTERGDQNYAARVVIRDSIGKATSIMFTNGEEVWGIDLILAERMGNPTTK